MILRKQKPKDNYFSFSGRLKKEGPLFDLPVAIAYLVASGDIEIDTEKRIYIGELSLDGSLRPVKGL